MTQLSLLQSDWITNSIPLVTSIPKCREWSTDDLHGLLTKPEVDNWYGVLIASLVNRGLIKRTGNKKSVRTEANGRWIGVYVVSGPNA